MISMDEFIAWRRAMDRFGPVGLHTLRLCRQNSVSKTVSHKRKKNDNSAIGIDRLRNNSDFQGTI